MFKGEDSKNYHPQINSINKFENPILIPIQIPNPTMICTKSCDRGGRPAKSFTRFRSTCKIIVQRKISTNSRNVQLMWWYKP